MYTTDKNMFLYLQFLNRIIFKIVNRNSRIARIMHKMRYTGIQIIGKDKGGSRPAYLEAGHVGKVIRYMENSRIHATDWCNRYNVVVTATPAFCNIQKQISHLPRTLHLIWSCNYWRFKRASFGRCPEISPQEMCPQENCPQKKNQKR